MIVKDSTVKVLLENAAVIGFTGEAKLVTNQNEITDSGTGAYTYVWQKIDSKWKVVHIHESAK